MKGRVGAAPTGLRSATPPPINVCMHFEFATAARIVFGPGVLHNAGKNLKVYGRRALVVTGRTVSRAEKLLADLQANDVGSVTFAVPGEPERDRRPHVHTNEVYRQTTEYRFVNAD